MINKLKKSFIVLKAYYKLKFILNSFFYKPNIGKDSYIDKNAQFIGLKHIQIGENSMIGDDCWLNVNKQEADDVEIEIGDNCFIGRRNFFSSGKSIIINDFFMSGPNCSFIGSNHSIDDPSKPYILTGATTTSSICIGSNVWIGTNSTVLGNVTIGHGSIIGANSLVIKDIPPFSIAVGNPAKIIKRFDFNNGIWTKDFEKLSNFMSEDEYQNELNQYLGSSMPLLASSKSFGSTW